MIQQIQGDTFNKVVTFPRSFADGYFVGWEVKSEIRLFNDPTLVAELECAWADPVTTRVLTLKYPDTSAWPVGRAEFDIQFTRTADGSIYSTQRMTVQIERSVTE